MKVQLILFSLLLLSINGKAQSIESAWGSFTPYESKTETKVDIKSDSIPARFLGMEQPGRFLSVDPLFHKYPSWSPYAYVMNNPLIYIDPTGKSTYIDRNGKVTEVTDDGSTSIFQVVENDDGVTYTNVGNTLVWDSFNTNDNIDLNSNWAGEQIENALNEIGGSFFTQYAPNGYGGRKYDLKTKLPKGKGSNFGSQLKDGVYVNPRESGNILTGAAARQGGLDAVTAFTGFGALQIGQDMARNVGVSNTFVRQGPAVAIGAAVFMSTMAINSNIGLAGVQYFGEEGISHFMQVYGYFNYKK